MSVCAVHADRPSVGTCPRCGRFVCAECAALQPCAECRARLAAKARPPARWLTGTVDALLALYVVFTVAMVPIGAQVDSVVTASPGMRIAPGSLVFLAAGTVYFVTWVVLIIAYLTWYASLIAWARDFEATDMSPGKAVGMWFVPLLNFVHPYVTMKGIATRARISAPLDAWWGVFALANVLSLVGSALPDQAKGYTPYALFLSANEIAAAVLCSIVVRRFSDFAWARSSAAP